MLEAGGPRVKVLAALLLLGLAVVAPARAEPASGKPDAPGGAGGDLPLGSTGLSLSGDRTTLLRLGAGAFDPLGIGGEKHNPGVAFAGHVEVRPGPKLLYLAPSAGLFANAKGGFYGYAGLSFDLDAGPLRFTPTLGLGAYEEGDGKDLGGVFEFLVAGSLTFPLGGGWRAGLSYAHLSNSRVHEENPGTEMILGIVDVPLFR